MCMSRSGGGSARAGSRSPCLAYGSPPLTKWQEPHALLEGRPTFFAMTARSIDGYGQATLADVLPVRPCSCRGKPGNRYCPGWRNRSSCAMSQDAHSWRLGPMAMQALLTISVRLISMRCSSTLPGGRIALPVPCAVFNRSCPTFTWQFRHVRVLRVRPAGERHPFRVVGSPRVVARFASRRGGGGLELAVVAAYALAIGTHP